jgi:hypothetical protein
MARQRLACCFHPARTPLCLVLTSDTIERLRTPGVGYSAPPLLLCTTKCFVDFSSAMSIGCSTMTDWKSARERRKSSQRVTATTVDERLPSALASAHSPKNASSAS